jgi:gas vesicle protein
MKMSDDRRATGFLPGLIVGAVAGAAVALLTAPRSGRENRDLLKAHFPEASDEAEGLIQRVTGEVRQRIESGREAFHQGKEEVRARMTEEYEQARRRGPTAT